MSYGFKKQSGTASVAGEIIYSAPSSTTLTLVGCRVSNKDSNSPHTFSITIDGILVSGKDTPLPVGSAIDIMVGSKLFVEPTSVIRAYADEDDKVDVYISYLEQSTTTP